MKNYIYNINITEIYFYFILSNDHIENNNYCLELDGKNIKYIFFSIENNCLFKERDNHKIKNLLYFEKKDALIYLQKINYFVENENIIKLEP